MNKSFFTKLRKILEIIYGEKNNFYAKKYSKSGLTKKQIVQLTSIKSLPITTLKELSSSSFNERLLKEKSGHNKMIFSPQNNRYFIVHRNLDEIRDDHLPLQGARPMVLLDDMYEAIERCLFFYEHKILPLIGEVLNPAVVYATAQQYSIDSLFIDHICIEKFREGLVNLKLPLKSMTVIDSQFSLSDLEWPKKIKLNVVLSLPEFGSIAYACPDAVSKKKFIFHPFPDVFVEEGKQTILTSIRLKANPMIRYKSNLVTKKLEKECNCRNISQSFLLGD